MGTLVCTVELDKKTGVIVKIADESGGATQTIACNGKTLVMTVKDKKGTTTYTQSGDKVVIKTKTFEVQATDITLKAKGKVNISASRGMQLSSNGKMALKSKLSMIMSGNSVAITGKLSLKAKGGASKLGLAAVAAKLSTPGNLTMEGKLQSALKGTMVNVKAKAMMNLNTNGIATLKGSLTNVKGMLVNVG